LVNHDPTNTVCLKTLSASTNDTVHDVAVSVDTPPYRVRLGTRLLITAAIGDMYESISKAVPLSVRLSNSSSFDAHEIVPKVRGIGLGANVCRV
jgi:hypothetical protein